MGDASSVRLAIDEETTFGVAEPAGSYQFLRFNDEGLKHSQESIQSGEIDPSRQPAGNVRVNVFAEGPINSEMSLVAPAEPPTGFDRLLEGLLMDDWQAPVSLTGESIDIGTPAGGTFDLTDQDVSADAFADVEVGDWVRLGGFTVNGTIYVHVTAKTGDDDITVEGTRSDGSAVTAEAGETAVTVQASRLLIGTTKKSYTIEKQFTDLGTPEYSLYTGMRVGTLDFRVSPQAILSLAWGFTGKLAATTTSSSVGSPSAKWATPRLNAVSHVPLRFEGAFNDGGVNGHRFAELNWRFDNRLRTEPEIGVQGSTDIGISTPTLSGSILTYMSTADLVRKLEQDTLSKAAWLLDDGTRRMLVSLPRIRYADGDILARGNDQSVQVRLDWNAEPDDNGIGLSLHRF